MDRETLRHEVHRILPGVRSELDRLIRIPSVSALAERHDDVERSAEATRALFEAEGFDTQILRSGDGKPAVLAQREGPDDAPTVLLYAHHDVQPTGDLNAWHSDPFEPQERSGRLYGRGAADDKAGLAAHLAAVRAFGEHLPVGIKVFVEGEEEIGSPTLEAFVAEHGQRLSADVMVIADSANWDVGAPALTTSLRGLVQARVDVRTLRHAVHSGLYGGAAPDALMVLNRVLASLHHDDGSVAVDGLAHSIAADVEYPEHRFRAESGLADGVEPIGRDSIVQRLWASPALTITGIDAPATREASNTLLPTASAMISMRIAPGDSCASAFDRLREHIDRHTPWSAHVTVSYLDGGEPVALPSEGPVWDAARASMRTAWDGTAPIDMGMGGSIPFISTFADAFPDTAILVTGVEDPDTRAHGTNESLHLAEWARVCEAQALFLHALGQAEN